MPGSRELVWHSIVSLCGIAYLCGARTRLLARGARVLARGGARARAVTLELVELGGVRLDVRVDLGRVGDRDRDRVWAWVGVWVGDRDRDRDRDKDRDRDRVRVSVRAGVRVSQGFGGGAGSG